MQKTIRLLSVLLGAQLLLALGVNVAGSSLAEAPADEPLLTLDADAVDRVSITDGDGNEVVLTKAADGWQLPGADGFPADADKVERLLDALAGLTAGPAVATSDSARTRFKVATDAFERRIVLAAGEKPLATLYFGTSPGMGESHARRDGSDAIHAVEFASYQAPTKAEDWEDKTVLQIPAEEIAAIRLGSGTDLERAEAAGEAADAAKGWQWSQTEPLDQAAVDALTAKLANLTFGSVLGREEKPEYNLAEPALTLTVTRRGGETVEYRLGKLKDGDGYALKVSSRPEIFRLPPYNADSLIMAADPETLIAEQSEESEQTAEAAQQS